MSAAALLRPARRDPRGRAPRRPRADAGPRARGDRATGRRRRVVLSPIGGPTAASGARSPSSSARPTTHALVGIVDGHEQHRPHARPRRRPEPRRPGHLRLGRPHRRAATSAAAGRYRLRVDLPSADREMIWPRRITVVRRARPSRDRLGRGADRDPRRVRRCRGRGIALAGPARPRRRRCVVAVIAAPVLVLRRRLGRAAGGRLPRRARPRSSRRFVVGAVALGRPDRGDPPLAARRSRSPPSRSCRCASRSRSAARPRTCSSRSTS